MKLKMLSLAFSVCLLIVFLYSCSAYDLGSAGNYSFAISPGDVNNPQWEHGIRDIVTYKCATCHSMNEIWYKPKNIPEYPDSENIFFGLNYIQEKEFFNSGNSMLSLVKKCIETPESRCGRENVPMPPNYATPLSEDERTALVNFVSNLLSESKSSGLSSHFMSNCAGCHPTSSGYSSSMSLNKKIGGDRSDTFEKYRAVFTSLPPMPSSGGLTYSDSDARADWLLITGKSQ